MALTIGEVREQQIAYDRFSDAVAGFLGVNRTDLRCLDIVSMRGTQTAGDLARTMGLSSGAVTAMLDRLEKAGFVRRVRDTADRRRVLIELTELLTEKAGAVYGPFIEATEPMFARFTDADLEVLHAFLHLGNEFYAVQTARVEELARERLARRGFRPEPITDSVRLRGGDTNLDVSCGRDERE
jgi:DNA-binding MarR family transcriptional regulator